MSAAGLAPAFAAVRARDLGRPDLGRDYLQPHWSELSRMDADERAALAIALIDCIPGLMHDPARGEDVKKVDCDDDGRRGSRIVPFAEHLEP